MEKTLFTQVMFNKELYGIIKTHMESPRYLDLNNTRVSHAFSILFNWMKVRTGRYHEQFDGLYMFALWNLRRALAGRISIIQSWEDNQFMTNMIKESLDLLKQPVMQIHYTTPTMTNYVDCYRYTTDKPVETYWARFRRGLLKKDFIYRFFHDLSVFKPDNQGCVLITYTYPDGAWRPNPVIVSGEVFYLPYDFRKKNTNKRWFFMYNMEL